MKPAILAAGRHRGRPTAGIMWHPEREAPFDPRDIAIVSNLYRGLHL